MEVFHETFPETPAGTPSPSTPNTERSRVFTRRRVLEVLCVSAIGGLAASIPYTKRCPQPMRFARLQPERTAHTEARYTNTLRFATQDIAKLFPHAAAQMATNPHLLENQQLWEDGEKRELSIEKYEDAVFRITMTHEGKNGNVLSIELWPKHEEIRRKKTCTDAKYGKVTDTTWTTPNDELHTQIAENGDVLTTTMGGVRINPWENPEDLSRKLSTLQRIALFQQTYFHSCESNVWNFATNTYRPNFAETQNKKFKTLCNGYAECAGELGTRHGGEMELISVRPPGLGAVSNGLHIFAMTQMNGDCAVLDGGTLTYVPNLQTYLDAKQYIELPGVGRTKWEYADSTVGRYAQQLGLQWGEKKEPDYEGEVLLSMR